MAEIYNPVNFITENIYAVLPEKGKLKKIVFSGFIKRFFQTNSRPNGIIKIIFQKDNQEEELQLFIKQHKNAKLVFDQMALNYQNLGSLQANKHIPKPIVCDQLHGATYMEYFKGTPLKYIIARNIALNQFFKLSVLFNKIGNWLNLFHTASSLKRTVGIETILMSVQHALNKSDYFKDVEKSIILKNLDNKRFTQKELVLVKPHNDFAIRNIMYIHPDNFAVIDWDAMFHNKFPSEAPVWNDITSFTINLLSFSRFSPVTRKIHIQKLINSFIKGYFFNNSSLKEEDIYNYLYLFSLAFYLGVIGDRPLPEIYRNRLGRKFMMTLHNSFLKGDVFYANNI